MVDGARLLWVAAGQCQHRRGHDCPRRERVRVAGSPVSPNSSPQCAQATLPRGPPKNRSQKSDLAFPFKVIRAQEVHGRGSSAWAAGHGGVPARGHGGDLGAAVQWRRGRRMTIGIYGNCISITQF